MKEFLLMVAAVLIALGIDHGIKALILWARNRKGE